MAMELWQLKYFLAVADELNYGRAAARLNVAQPSVTRAVQGLENELGVTLFLRDKRRVELTPAGRVFADEARRLLAGLEIGVRQARRLERGEVGTLTIGFEGLSAFAFISHAVQAFQAHYPDVTIDLLEMSAAEQAIALKDHRIELGFVVPSIDDPAITVEVVGSESLVLAMPTAHRLAQERTVKAAQLAGERLIGSSTLCGSINKMAALGVDAEQPVAQVSDGLLRLCFVAAGLGLTVMPASVAEVSVGELTRAGISYRPLQPPLHVELAIARLKSARADAALERFVEAARHACQAHDSRRAAAASEMRLRVVDVQDESSGATLAFEPPLGNPP
jgi:LysR family transcriptional regulator, benzoate and cis,cis-muconate-responsive activator of ben and cat genes